MALSLQPYTWSDCESRLYQILKERAVKERERSTVLAIKIGEALPENVIFEILSWLPVKELLQFKSVCKSWYAIISSADFVSKHLSNYYKNKSDDEGCLLVQYFASQAEFLLSELLVDETPRVLAEEVLYNMPMYGSYVCGPCDGIYCLFYYHKNTHAFWNPVTNELKDLPPIITRPNLPSNLIHRGDDGYGFGYDSTTNDYKLIVLKNYWTESNEEFNDLHLSSVFIYSLKRDSWRYKADLAQEYRWKNKCYMFLNGCYYWLGICKQGWKVEQIISYDMGTDTIQEMQVPDNNDPTFTNIAIYKSSLAFLAVEPHENRLDIWTWNEGRWTKSFTMGISSWIRHPIGHWNDKIILETADDGLCICDPMTHEVKDIKSREASPVCEGVYVYRESLLSLKDKKWC